MGYPVKILHLFPRGFLCAAIGVVMAIMAQYRPRLVRSLDAPALAILKPVAVSKAEQIAIGVWLPTSKTVWRIFGTITELLVYPASGFLNYGALVVLCD